jgi:hypothetical protein
VDDHASKDTRFSGPEHILAHKALPIPANPAGLQKLPKRIVSSYPYVQAVAVRKIVTETARGRGQYPEGAPARSRQEPRRYTMPGRGELW